MGPRGSPLLCCVILRDGESSYDLRFYRMTRQIATGDMVRRIEPPANGPARVSKTASGLYEIHYELEYAEGGSGWWPGDSLELVNMEDS